MRAGPSAKNAPVATFLPTAPDTSVMKEAKDWLTVSDIPFKQVSASQLKINTLSYYPGSGSFNYDSCRSEPGRGLQALRDFLITLTGRDLPPIKDNAMGVAI